MIIPNLLVLYIKFVAGDNARICDIWHHQWSNSTSTRSNEETRMVVWCANTKTISNQSPEKCWVSNNLYSKSALFHLVLIKLGSSYLEKISYFFIF